MIYAKASIESPRAKRILILDDDVALAKAITDYLVFEGYQVTGATRGDIALDLIRQSPPDLLLLDIMLPGKTGFDLMGVLRSRRRTPIIILTARSQKADRLRGFNLGADDYVTKPFDLEELCARIRVVLRRARPAVDTLWLDDVFVDFRYMIARRGLSSIHLTHREFELLQYLAERPEQVVHRDQLLREVWGFPELPHTRSVDHAVARLRRKVEPDPHSPQFIHTVHGDGYRFTPNGSVPCEA